MHVRVGILRRKLRCGGTNWRKNDLPVFEDLFFDDLLDL